MLPRTLTRRAGLAALALTFAIAAACGAHAKSNDLLVVAQPSDVLSLDASIDNSPISLNVFKNIYDQLTDIRGDGSVAPLLATAWETSPDAKVWTFTIRKDAKFHDGKPVTVADVVWTYQKIMADQKSTVRPYLVKVKSVEAVGDDKVRFNLLESFSPFDRQVSLISILPKAVYEALGPAGFAQKPVGSGPFKLVQWVKDDRVELVANDDYWGGAPKIRRVVFRPVPSEAARAAALVSGDLDVVPVLPPAQVQRLEARSEAQIEKVNSNRVLYLGFNVNNAPVSNLKLRQGIDMAIDREAITQRLLRGLGTPSGQVVAPVTFGYDPEVKPTAFDPAKAKALIQESGYKGEPILFQYPNNRYAFGEEVAQAVAGYLKAVGVNVELRGMEYSAFFPLWATRKLTGMHMFAFGPSIMDAELALGSLYDRAGRTYWLDPEVLDLIAQQRATGDPDKRREILGRIWRRSKAEVPYVVLYNEIQAYGITKGLKWHPRPDERLLFKDAEFTP